MAEEVEQQALETEKLAKYEVDELTHRLEECDQTIEELNAEIASTTQEMENIVHRPVRQSWNWMLCGSRVPSMEGARRSLGVTMR